MGENLHRHPNQAYRKEGMPPTLPVCPDGAPAKEFNVVAIDFPSMTFNPNVEEAIEVDFERKIEVQNPDAKIYVLEEEVKERRKTVEVLTRRRFGKERSQIVFS